MKQAGFCLLAYSLISKMEAVCSSGTLVDSRWSRRRYETPEDRTLAKYEATDVLNSTVLRGVMSFTSEKAVYFRGTYRLHRHARRVCEAGKPAEARGVSVWRLYFRSFSELHCVTTEKTMYCIVAAVKTSNPTDIFNKSNYFYTVFYPEDRCLSLCERKWIGTYQALIQFCLSEDTTKCHLFFVNFYFPVSKPLSSDLRMAC
jgi:hypothetical protein